MHGFTLGSMICNALDLDPQSIAELHLHCRADDVATVEIVRYVNREEGRDLVRSVSKFSLTPIPDP